MKINSIILLVLLLQQIAFAQVGFGDRVSTPRENYAIDVVINTLKKYGLEKYRKNIRYDVQYGKKEGYTIKTDNNNTTITGNDGSGLLYGCLAFADEIKKTNSFPKNLNLTDAPEMVLRGQCIGLQKSSYLPGRNVYEYPLTQETFPWFYNKKLWLQVLDSMLNNRMNSLYLWNGHPFASLVKLKEYPYAVEVDEATFKKNEEIYKFITTEADKRGIWVIQMFYNIIVSKPFAEFHKIKTQDRERHIEPIIADYTKKSIAAFVEKYPNVGLMVCLGEAMEGTGNDDIEWFTKTIIPGVQDGLKALYKTESLVNIVEPPIILRAHDCDAPAVMAAALPLYKNLYTEAKFNGEALTYQTPRGDWSKLHQKLSSLGSVQIENVHILANLEPFRYGAPKFIQESVIGMHEVMKGNGLHLYPQASYWDWPYSADSVQGGKRILQVERDWIWFKAWSRYAWKANRNKNDEIKYWGNVLANKYGCSYNDGLKILTSYNESGEVAPKLLRRFGITDGNRQTLTLGMLMTQLINPYRYGLFTLLYDSEAPEGESIIEFADKEFKKEKHIGETPIAVITETVRSAELALLQLKKVEKNITKNKEEFNKLKNDMECYALLASHFYQKVKAALYTLKYKYNKGIDYLDSAKMHLQKSVEHYKKLAQKTNATYLYANSMQTQQRKIPMRGFNGAYKHWNEMLPVFENELEIFSFKIDSIKDYALNVMATAPPLPNAAIDVQYNRVTLQEGATFFEDTNIVVTKYDPQLENLEGIKVNYAKQIAAGTTIHFKNDKKIKVVVGFFVKQKAAFTNDSIYLKEPELETNATADDYGQSDIIIKNAIIIKGMPPINIHNYKFMPGQNTLKLEKGICLILGFVASNQYIYKYDANLLGELKFRNVDWLFE